MRAWRNSRSDWRTSRWWTSARSPAIASGLGSTVVVLDFKKEEEITYKLVTSEESDVTNGLISTSSPIGRGLLGKQVGTR